MDTDILNHGYGHELMRRESFGMQNTTLQTTRTIERILFAFGGMALYNMLELLIQIPLRFNSWKGLYFWSLIISTVGILPYTLGLLFKFFGVIHGYPLVYLAITLIVIGWQTMVTVQRAVLWMIIANWFVSNIPTTVFVFGASSPNPGPYNMPYGVWERLQLCLYFVQEVIISCIYGVEVVRMLKPEFFDKQSTNASRKSTSTTHSFGKKVRNSNTNQRIMRHLLWINVMIIALDITLLVVEFVGHYEIQTLYKGFVYSVKLKMEFRILNQLTDIAQSRLRSSQAYFDDGSGPNGSSGSQWDPLESRRASVATATAATPTPRNVFGALSDIEKEGESSEEVVGSGRRKDSVIPMAQALNETRKISTIAPLESCMAGRTSESRLRRPSAVRVVSFTEGCGPSTRGDDKLEAKWRAMMDDDD